MSTPNMKTISVLYLRYMDDIFCTFWKDVLFENFNKKLNKLHKSTKFTFELGGNELPFLDVKINLTKDKVITKVHKKEFDTDFVLVLNQWHQLNEKGRIKQYHSFYWYNLQTRNHFKT